METYDEWRLILDVATRKGVDEVIAEALARTPDDVDIHRRRDQVLVYAFTEDAARSAGELVSGLLGQRGISVVPSLTRWNPGRERWQDPSLPVEPRKGDIGLEWVDLGELAWEVRVRSQSGTEARRLAEELLREGRPTIVGLRNRVTVGAAEATEAWAVADDLRLRAPTAEIAVRPLSRWRRWLIRQRLLGNYASGGDGGFEGGGVGGNGGG